MFPAHSPLRCLFCCGTLLLIDKVFLRMNKHLLHEHSLSRSYSTLFFKNNLVQCFSKREVWFCPALPPLLHLRKHLAKFGNTLGCHNYQKCYWHPVHRSQEFCYTLHKALNNPHNKESSSPNVSSAKIEKVWSDPVPSGFSWFCLWQFYHRMVTLLDLLQCFLVSHQLSQPERHTIL